MQPVRVAGMARAQGALILAVGFAVLVSAAVWLHHTVENAANFQRDVRVAQSARDRVFRTLLDQETSMRGFTSTRQIRFLAPYGNARASMDEAFAELHMRLAALGTQRLFAYVQDERRLADRWHDTVAAPLLAAPQRRDATRLQNAGRRLVDAFRNDDAAIDAGISQAASDADRAVQNALARITLVCAVLGLGFALAFSYFNAQRAAMRAEATRQRLLYENEKRIADTLQAAFVQKALPAIGDIGFHASYVPAGTGAQVGGDWYDAFELPDGRIMFSIGDVAGHGIEAAVAMSRARQAIVSHALHETDPGIVLRKANHTLILQESTMVTALCGYIEPTSLRITYATAGHPPPLLAVPRAQPFFFEYGGIPLGIFADQIYSSSSIQARPGALLVLYTDGVLEHTRDLFDGERRLLDAAGAVVAAGARDPAASIRHAIFAGSAPSDDAAIMTVSFGPAGFRRTRSTEFVGDDEYEDASTAVARGR